MYVKSVSLENIKGFKTLNFNFVRPSGTYAGWTVFVGGNASGKSTLLKSMALAIIGPDASRELLGPPLSWKGWIHSEERRSETTVSLTWDQQVDRFRKGGANPGSSFEAGMRFAFEPKDTASTRSEIPILRPIYKTTPKRTKILTPERGPWAINSTGWFSAGYGPMRRLTGSSSESVRFSMGVGSVSRYVTLFREDAALSESEAWIKTNHARWLENGNPELKDLIDNVTDLLSDDLLPQGMKISEVTVDHVYVRDTGGINLPMRDISDGCRGVYATVLDLIHGMHSVYGAAGLFSRDAADKPFIDKPGVVFIDEIEAHLHPSWQRNIPEWFKKHFPKVQFFVTTHSPLVAQAADQNGVFLLPSSGDLAVEPHQLDADQTERLRLGRAEKTLLGVAFGLKTVRSNWANTQIQKWKVLNAKKKAGVNLTRGESSEMDLLSKQMGIIFEQPVETA